MYPQTFNLTSSQNITSIPASLYTENTSAEDLTALLDTNIPDTLPPIDEVMAKETEIDDSYTGLLASSLSELMQSIPSFSHPQFIPHKSLHDNVNVQAQINRLIHHQPDNNDDTTKKAYSGGEPHSNPPPPPPAKMSTPPSSFHHFPPPPPSSSTFNQHPYHYNPYQIHPHPPPNHPQNPYNYSYCTYYNSPPPSTNQ